MIQHVILQPGEPPRVESSTLDYDTIVGIVGHPVEVITILGGRAVMYRHGEGTEVNAAATTLANGALRDGDAVKGTALVVGPLGPGGDESSLTLETIQMVMDALN